MIVAIEAFAAMLVAMQDRSYYEILGVPRDADPQCIREAFHDFARVYHPDQFAHSPAVAGAALEVFKRGVEAYRCLSRSGPRERYDRALVCSRLREGRPPVPAQAWQGRPN